MAIEKDFIVKNGLVVVDNISVGGTVDGRDIAADGSKLDGIESGATADQSITAGNGLTGGGTGDVTINIGQGTGITVSADSISTNDSQIVHDNLSGFVANEHIDHSAVTLTAGVGLNGGGTIAASRTFNIDSAEIYANFSHDAFKDFVANEHVNHTTVTLTAGAGLTGGGDISASRTFDIGQGTGITVSADAISTNDTQIVHDNLSGFVANEHIDHSTVTLTAGVGLNGGGTIAASRTFNIDSAELYANFNHDGFTGFVADEHIAHTSVTLTAGVGLNGGGNITAARTFNVDSAELYAYFNHDAFTGFVANEHVDHTAVTLTAGNGLTGGGDISASRTFAVGQGTGITVSADAISTNDGQIVHDNLSGFVANEHIDHSTVSVTAGNGLTGGGTIAATRTINVGAGTGVTVTADAVSIGQAVDSSAAVFFGSVQTTGNIVVGGNLQVTGVTTTVGTQDLIVTDNMIYMNEGIADSAGAPIVQADIGFAAGVNDNGYYEHVGLFRDASDDRFKVFKGYTPEPDSALEIDTAHGSFALADFQASTFYGALSGNATTATTWANGRTLSLTGDVTGTSASFDGSGNISISTTIAANSVALSTDTTGNYVASITNGSYITGGNGGSEGAALTLAVDATSANTVSKVVARDASGNFSAGTITAALSGNATTATTLETARTINGTSFNGSLNIVVEPYVEDDAATNATRYLVFVDNSTAGYKRLNEDADLNYNPSTNTLTTGTFSGALSGNATTATTLQTARTIAISGDITGSATSFNGSADITISAGITAGSIVNADINASAAIADTKLATISTAGKVSNSATTATSANTVSAIVARDASGNFSAGTITAALTGNASTATTLQTARTIAISGDVTGSATSFNGSADITISAGITAGSIVSADFNSATSLIIYNSAGSAVKTIYSPGS